jgi:hypothetical protein
MRRQSPPGCVQEDEMITMDTGVYVIIIIIIKTEKDVIENVVSAVS